MYDKQIFCSLYNFFLNKQMVIKKLSVYQKAEFGPQSLRAAVWRANTGG